MKNSYLNYSINYYFIISSSLIGMAGCSDHPSPVAILRGNRIAIAGKDVGTFALAREGEVEVWSLDPLERKDTFQSESPGPITSLAISPEGKHVAGCIEGTIILWDVTTRSSRECRLNLATPTAITIDPDGGAIAAGLCDGTVIIIDSNNLKIINQFAGSNHCIMAMTFSPDGRFLAVAGGGARRGDNYAMSLFETNNWSQIGEVLHMGMVNSVCFWEADSVFSASNIGQVFLFKTNNNSYREFYSYDMNITDIACSARILAIAGGGPSKFSNRRGAITLLDPATGKRIGQFGANGGGIMQIAMTSDGGTLFSCGPDGNIYVWKIP